MNKCMYIVFFCNLYCVCVTGYKNVSMRTFTEKQIFALVFLHNKYVAFVCYVDIAIAVTILRKRIYPKTG